jgi:hypothetical protein
LLTVVANRTTIKSLSERKLLIMADAKEIEETALIDRNMDQVFDWAKGNERRYLGPRNGSKWSRHHED